MRTKAIIGYLAVVTLSFALHAIKPENTIYYSLLPFLMLLFPVVACHSVKLRFSIKDIFLGLIVSFIILAPYHIISEGTFRTVTGYAFLFQLLGVALPEEFFFRGFLQDSVGRNYKAVAFVSLLFAIAHLPNALFLGDWISLLTFFPSLAMGWLYMKTNNIVPGTIFHLFANLMYQGHRYL